MTVNELRQPAALALHGVNVSIAGKAVCHDVSFDIQHGEVHVLFGQNGSGKSSLLSAIMGLPGYQVTGGDIRLDDRSLVPLTLDARARLGLGMAFQRPPSFEGVTVGALARSMHAQDALAREERELNLEGFGSRDINSGFSGGEIKRWETLKLLLQRPLVSLFDEPESGVDLEHIAAVGESIERLVRTPRPDGELPSALIITHTGFILDYVKADVGHLMVDGRIVYSGDPLKLFAAIRQNGYRAPDEASTTSSTAKKEG
ncbi:MULTISPECIES: ABC transporter ATP-binding protein [unclassified Pseudoclavibacter]|uniref:ABC transporter ATP-binding protein n=1 Tax=unclassified Pseudoclavibacter TaxID=2615177 RepID=UPI001301924E|nr:MULTISPECIES: ATP-binding cassette domain-containing protein [unclassified Pseudoclavibacter]KAB1658702.1 ATP-binding cassette domain-containing protein [Pseudoclavibacter sp. CFCC 11306]KAB1661237.1 ATP-binding cassette domain-containing protein [Pseudoclavibacter sp. CFCC 13796]